MKIKYKLLAITIIILTLIIGLNFWLIQKTEGQLTEKINDNLNRMNGQLVSEIETVVQHRLEYWKGFADLPTTRKSLVESNYNFSRLAQRSEFIAWQDKEWVSAPKEVITPFMKEILGNDLSLRLKARKEFYEKEYHHSVYPEIFVSNKYGAVIGSTGKTSDYYQADEQWWQIAKENGFYLGEVEYDDSSETYSLVGAARIEDNDGNFLGVVKFLINTEEIKRIIQKGVGEDNIYEKDYYLTLLNGENKVIYKTEGITPLGELSAHELEELNAIDHNEGDVILMKSDLPGIKGELVVHRHFSSQGPLKDLNWKLITEFDAAEILAPVRDLEKQVLLFSSIIFTLALVIMLLFSRSIYDPIRKLQGVAEKMEKGNLNVRANIKNKDELGVLGEAMNTMSKKLGYQQQDLDKKVKERTKELEEKKNEAEKSKKAVLNILEDVEEAQRKLKQSYFELKGLDKLKTEFLSFTSHELRTPLTPIRSQLQRLLAKDLAKEEQHSSLEMVLRNTNRLDKLINDILDISRIESKRLKIFKKKTNIISLLETVVRQMSYFAKEKGITIKTHLEKCPKSVFLDEDRMEQVLINLIDNAIKHSETKEIIITGVKNGNKLELCVKDKGRGITKEEQEHLFEAFHYRGDAKLSPKGAGLGLAICKGIVHEHGGNIWFKTKLGEGTTFCIDLPM